jgi:hypothetical protein
MDQLAKGTAVNKNDRLPNNGYTSLTHVKVSVRRSCLKNWTKYTMKMHRKKRMGKFYMQHFGINSTHWKAYKTITAKRTYAALNQLKLGHRYFRSYLIRTPNCESDRYFNSCRTKQTPEHLLMSCRTYRLERQSIIKIAKQHKDEPRPLKFAHLFKNATIINEILKFLQKTEIATRN